MPLNLNMRSKKIVIICLLCLIVLFWGASSIDVNCYKSTVSSSISSKWNNSQSIGRFNESKEEIPFLSVPVIVVYKSKIVGDVHSPNPIKIEILDGNFGPVWLPLFKYSNFNFTVICKENHEVKTDHTIGRLFIDGEMKVSGNYRIVGLCSSEIAIGLIMDRVMDDIYKEAKKHTGKI